MGLKDRFNSTVESKHERRKDRAIQRHANLMRDPNGPNFKWPCTKATLDVIEVADHPLTESQIREAVLVERPDTHPFHVTCAILELHQTKRIKIVHGRYTACD